MTAMPIAPTPVSATAKVAQRFHHHHSNSWAGFNRAAPLPSPPLSVYAVELDPEHIQHAAATSFQRDLYNVRTKDKGMFIPDSHTHFIEVLSVSRLINRPENLSARVELPASVRHLRLKNTQLDIPASLRAGAAPLESVTLFIDLPWGKTTVAAPPCAVDELVLNVNYTPQRPCRLDATSRFAVKRVTVILHPSHRTAAGPHRMLLQDIQDLVASIALATGNEGVVATIVADGLDLSNGLRWMTPDRGQGNEYIARYLRTIGDRDPSAALEVIDMQTYKARVGDDVTKRHTVW